MEFTEIDELNDMIVYSKSYRPSLIPKYSKFFDLDFKSPSDLNYFSLDNLIENSFEDIPSPSPENKNRQVSKGITFESEKKNETIEEILNDISTSIANFELNISIVSPTKKRSEETPLLSPIKEQIKKEESHREHIESNSATKKEERSEENNGGDGEEKKQETSSMDERKSIIKRQDGDISQTFTEKRKITSCLTENIRMSKGPVISCVF